MIVGGGTGREETVSIRNNFFFNAILGVVALCLSGCRPGVLLLDSLRRIVAGIARRQYQPTFNFAIWGLCWSYFVFGTFKATSFLRHLRREHRLEAAALWEATAGSWDIYIIHFNTDKINCNL